VKYRLSGNPNIVRTVTRKSYKSFKIFLAESYLLYMSIKRTWTWNQAKNWGVSQKSGRSHGLARPPL